MLFVLLLVPLMVLLMFVLWMCCGPCRVCGCPIVGDVVCFPGVVAVGVLCCCCSCCCCCPLCFVVVGRH